MARRTWNASPHDERINPHSSKYIYVRIYGWMHARYIVEDRFYDPCARFVFRLWHVDVAGNVLEKSEVGGARIFHFVWRISIVVCINKQDPHISSALVPMQLRVLTKQLFSTVRCIPECFVSAGVFLAKSKSENFSSGRINVGIPLCRLSFNPFTMFYCVSSLFNYFYRLEILRYDQNGSRNVSDSLCNIRKTYSRNSAIAWHRRVRLNIDMGKPVPTQTPLLHHWFDLRILLCS